MKPPGGFLNPVWKLRLLCYPEVNKWKWWRKRTQLGVYVEWASWHIYTVYFYIYIYIYTFIICVFIPACVFIWHLSLCSEYLELQRSGVYKPTCTGRAPCIDHNWVMSPPPPSKKKLDAWSLGLLKEAHVYATQKFVTSGLRLGTTHLIKLWGARLMGCCQISQSQDLAYVPHVS